jgi:hypothetical protein
VESWIEPSLRHVAVRRVLDWADWRTTQEIADDAGLDRHKALTALEWLYARMEADRMREGVRWYWRRN